MQSYNSETTLKQKFNPQYLNSTSVFFSYVCWSGLVDSLRKEHVQWEVIIP